jgi:cobaltochelatase CobN
MSPRHSRGRPGLLPLIDARNWRDDADLAEVYAARGGFAYGCGLDGREARADMETSYRRIAVGAHNTDTLEHDIADSGDYFQYHGGMIVTVRALTGRAPARLHRRLHLSGHRPHPVAGRGDRAGVPRPVVNPRWVEAMTRHGYMGVSELAATVDYLFGYDATAGVVEDWMYRGSPGLTSLTMGCASSSPSPIRGCCTGPPNGCWRPPPEAVERPGPGNPRRAPPGLPGD